MLTKNAPPHYRLFWALARKIIRNFESNPRVQYRVHLIATYYWLLNFPIVAYLFFFQAPVWIKLGLLLNTFYSLYANFATDYGAVSAALAAQQNANEAVIDLLDLDTPGGLGELWVRLERKLP